MRKLRENLWWESLSPSEKQSVHEHQVFKDNVAKEREQMKKEMRAHARKTGLVYGNGKLMIGDVTMKHIDDFFSPVM